MFDREMPLRVFWRDQSSDMELAEPSSDDVQGADHLDSPSPPQETTQSSIPAAKSDQPDIYEGEDVSLSRPGPEYTPDSFDELPHDEIYLGGYETLQVYRANKHTEQIKSSDLDDLRLVDVTPIAVESALIQHLHAPPGHAPSTTGASAATAEPEPADTELPAPSLALDAFVEIEILDVILG
ncbi:hypothetical protein BR93DRAFT_922101 [Coniochaeta sp. PMI_546]|nr:hypothetical protein BR93DRAFT_922101 [Coniochaeta sp. PMI_546]